MMLFSLLLLSTSVRLVSGSQMATFFVQPDDFKVSHRQNFCERHNAFLNSTNSTTLDMRRALEGLKLNVALGAYDGSFFNYDAEKGIDPYNPGIAAELMDELADRGGFTWRDTFGVYYLPAQNTSWTDLLLWSIETYDLNVDWWAKNVDRMEKGAVYIKEWYDSSMILVGKQDPNEKDQNEGELNWWGFVRPFDSSVWIATVATIVASGLAFLVIEWLEGDRKDRSLWVWTTENVYLSAMSFTQMYGYGNPRSVAQKIFGVSMAFWGLIMVASYTAELASLLVETRIPVIRPETLADASLAGYRVCTFKGTYSDEFVEQNYPSIVRLAKDSQGEMYEALNRGECELAVESKQSWLGYKNIKEYNPNCDLEWVGKGRIIESSLAGFVTSSDAGIKCTSIVRDVLNLLMEDMIQEQALDDAWNREHQRRQNIDCSSGSAELLSQLEEGENDEGRRKLLRQKQQKEGGRKSRRRLVTESPLTGDSRSGDQLKFNQMFGVFAFHWMLMTLSLFLTLIKIAIIKVRQSEGKEDDNANQGPKRKSSRISFSRGFSKKNTDHMTFKTGLRNAMTSKTITEGSAKDSFYDDESMERLHNSVEALSKRLERDHKELKTRVLEEQFQLKKDIQCVLEFLSNEKQKQHSL